MCPSTVLSCLLLAAVAGGPVECKTADPPKTAKFVVDVHLAVVDDVGRAVEVDTKATGEIAKPLVAVVTGLNQNEKKIHLEIKANRVAGGKASRPAAMYVVRLRLVECQPGKRPTVLASPAVVTVVDHAAEIKVGQQNGPRTEAKIRVTEIR